MDQDFNNIDEIDAILNDDGNEIKPLFNEIDDDDRKEEMMAKKFYLYEMLQKNDEDEIEEMINILEK